MIYIYIDIFIEKNMEMSKIYIMPGMSLIAGVILLNSLPKDSFYEYKNVRDGHFVIHAYFFLWCL